MTDYAQQAYVSRAYSISVIVPVYKVEPYLPQCIDSILGQTFSDFELILVDDGSPDNCPAICDEYARKDGRIVVLHQENGGLSAARNTGIDWVFANSNSPWLTFVDSDDCLAPNCLEELYRNAQEADTDIVVTGGHMFSEEAELETAPCHIVSVRHETGRDCCREMYLEQNFFMNYAWGKLYRRELFRSLRYPVGKLYEDEALAPRILLGAQNVTILRSWLYRYRQRPDSIVHKPFGMHCFDLLDAADANVQFLRSQGDDELVRLAEHRRKRYAAKYTLLARHANMLRDVQPQYKMSVWNAWILLLTDALRRDGVKHVMEKIINRSFRLRRN